MVFRVKLFFEFCFFGLIYASGQIMKIIKVPGNQKCGFA